MRCHGPGDEDCCSYYSDSLCVNECPGVCVPDTSNTCVCQPDMVGSGDNNMDIEGIFKLLEEI